MPRITRSKWLANHAKKRDHIVRLYSDGKTMEVIAARLGISRQRVSQVIAGAKVETAK